MNIVAYVKEVFISHDGEIDFTGLIYYQIRRHSCLKT